MVRMDICYDICVLILVYALGVVLVPRSSLHSRILSISPGIAVLVVLTCANLELTPLHILHDRQLVLVLEGPGLVHGAARLPRMVIV